MTIEEILEEMENMLLDAPRVPFTNKRMIEEDELARLLDELREVLPHEVTEAKRIINDRQRIMEEAQREAQNIVNQGKTYISKLTDENIITKQAQDQADEIVNQARKAAWELQGEANAYADNVFQHLERNLEKALEVVRQGRASFHQNKAN
ncbi:MAG: ATPase [Negativicutes bacterium]|nr:ATPase [Negativicutes bacterium]